MFSGLARQWRTRSAKNIIRHVIRHVEAAFCKGTFCRGGFQTKPARKPAKPNQPESQPGAKPYCNTLPGSLLYVLYVLYLTRQRPLFPSSLLYVLYVLYILYARKFVVYVLHRAM